MNQDSYDDSRAKQHIVSEQSVATNLRSGRQRSNFEKNKAQIKQEQKKNASKTKETRNIIRRVHQTNSRS